LACSFAGQVGHAWDVDKSAAAIAQSTKIDIGISGSKAL
jgi:hypothetical protein